MKPFIMLVMTLLVCGCVKNRDHTKETISSGENLSLSGEQIPQRVVTGGALPYVATWYVVNESTKELVGMHPRSYAVAKESMLMKLSPEITQTSTNFFHNGELNVEELLQLNPDLYFEGALLGKNIEKVRSVGIPVIALPTLAKSNDDTFGVFYSWLKTTAELTHKEDRVKDFITGLQQTQGEIEEKIKDIPMEKRPKVLYLHNHQAKAIYAAGDGLFGNQWIHTTGGVDVTTGNLRGVQEVSMEQIYRWNPDIIILTNFTQTTPEDLIENRVEGQDWSLVKAIENKAVYKTPVGVFRWSSATGDAPLMLKWMAQVLHPDLFPYDMEEELYQYYQDFYHYELDEEEIESMLYPKSGVIGAVH